MTERRQPRRSSSSVRQLRPSATQLPLYRSAGTRAGPRRYIPWHRQRAGSSNLHEYTSSPAWAMSAHADAATCAASPRSPAARRSPGSPPRSRVVTGMVTDQPDHFCRYVLVVRGLHGAICLPRRRGGGHESRAGSVWPLNTAVRTGMSLRRCQSADPGYRQAARRLPTGTTGPRHRAPEG
jgi:hypothetical protein